jgi:hypothetical protein
MIISYRRPELSTQKCTRAATASTPSRRFRRPDLPQLCDTQSLGNHKHHPIDAGPTTDALSPQHPARARLSDSLEARPAAIMR